MVWILTLSSVFLAQAEQENCLRPISLVMVIWEELNFSIEITSSSNLTFGLWVPFIHARMHYNYHSNISWDLKRMKIFNWNCILVWVAACMLRHIYPGKNAIHIATFTCNGDLKRMEIFKWNYIFEQFDTWALSPIYICKSAILICHRDLKRMEIFNWNFIFEWVAACMLRHVYPGKNAIHIGTLMSNGDLKRMEIFNWNYIFEQFDTWAFSPIYTCKNA